MWGSRACHVKYLEPGRFPKAWNRARLYDFLIKHDGRQGSEMAAVPPAARHATQFQGTTHGVRLANCMVDMAQEFRDMCV